MLSLKNRIPSHLPQPLTRLTLIAVLLVFFISGCAQKPWGDPFQEDVFTNAKAEVAGYIARRQSCENTITADLAVFYEDPLGKQALKGFLELSRPKAFKFVVTNPFGQPIFAVGGNSKTFEALIVRESQFVSGTLDSFALRHKLPLEFVKGDWGSWLTGRCQESIDEINEIREDQDGRGLWAFFPANRPPFVGNALLFSREFGNVLERLLQNKDGKTIARITYAEWSAPGAATCQQPAHITVSDLGYGTTINLKLSNIEISSAKVNYDLKPPKGYSQQYLP